MSVSSAPSLLVLIRHGESTRNVAKKGSIFFPDAATREVFAERGDHETLLTEAGLVQARAAGVDLRSRFGAFDLVFHSGYERTRDTATAILDAWPDDERNAMEVREHLLVRERDTGYTANMTTEESAAAFPWLQAYWDATGPFLARPPGGESLADVAVRAQLFLDSLSAELSGRRTLIVTHAGTLRMFRYLIEGWSYDEIARRWREETIPNCASVSYRADSFTGRLILDHTKP